jgi:flagellar hook-associated protein 1
MSLSSSLLISIGAMQADQDVMNVSSNNIANVNTPGYSRETVNLAENPPVTIGNNLQIGTGVTVEGIQGIRDSVLQLRLNQETQTQGQQTAFSTGMNQIQTAFNDTSGTGLQSLISQFFGSFQQLAADPTNTGLRQATLGDAQDLASGFQQTATTLIQQQQSADQGVTQTVQQINNLTSQIAQLNGEISNSGGNQNSNTLVDQRSELINQLSSLVDVQQVTADGNSLTLQTNGGTLLVVGNQSFGLSTSTNANGFQDVFSQGKDITSTIQSGQLAGDIQLRDQEIPSILSNLDTLANGIITSVNTQNAAGVDLNGAAGGNIFAPAAAVAGSALNMSVTMTDPTKIAASADGTPGNNANATALANLQNQNIISGQTPVNFYSGIVFQVGNGASSATNQLNGTNLLVQQLQDQVGAVSGVSLNEEAGTIVQFQNAYEAAAEAASVIATLFQVTINMASTV